MQLAVGVLVHLDGRISIYYLAKNPMRVFTRDQLLNHIWGEGYRGDSRTVDVHIKRIREKIGNGTSWRLDTVWGKGYKFEIFN